MMSYRGDAYCYSCTVPYIIRQTGQECQSQRSLRLFFVCLVVGLKKAVDDMLRFDADFLGRKRAGIEI